MKPLLAILALVVASALAYRIHHDQFERAIADARAMATAESASLVNELAAKKKAPTPKPLNGVAIARNLEPLYAELLSDLDTSRPADLVPPLEITRERILDHKSRVEPAKHPIYDLGAQAASVMINAAEERTSMLDALMRNIASGRSSLDTVHSSRTSGDFFAETAMKRWEQERKRHKPVVETALQRLRDAERTWNARVGANAQFDNYDLPDLTPVYVSADRATGSRGALDTQPYNRARIYPWRQNYYNRYGSTSGGFSQ